MPILPFRTSGACGGMPKGEIVTTIPNNQKINIEWHLGYAHKGKHTDTGTQNHCLLHKPYLNRGILTGDTMS